MFYVYEIRIDQTGKICYVGKGSGDRLNFHATQVRRGKCVQPLHRKLQELVTRGFTFSAVKVQEFEDEATALSAERWRIAHYGMKNLFNSVAGGAGWTKTPEMRKRMSDAKRGIRLSAAHKRRISEALLGITRSAETRAKMSLGMRRSPLHAVSNEDWRAMRNSDLAVAHGLSKDVVKAFRHRYSKPFSPYFFHRRQT